MRVDDIFPPEVIDEDIRKWMGGALAAGALAAAPVGMKNVHDTNAQASIAQDIAVLAQTMWGEARNHGTVGMLAIGNVVKNRAESDRGLTFGHGIRGVALKHKQFSCWNPSDPNRDKIEEMKKLDQDIKSHVSPDPKVPFDQWFKAFQTTPEFGEFKAWREAYFLAQKIMLDQVPDPTKGAFFYHTTSVHPRWSIGAEPISQVANHVFYQRVH
jgi:spore germination cell wall hydrolase CwlJ-like protein